MNTAAQTNPFIEQLLELEFRGIDHQIIELQAEKSALDNKLHRLTEYRCMGYSAVKLVQTGVGDE